jgi:hypothetical protein
MPAKALLASVADGEAELTRPLAVGTPLGAGARAIPQCSAEQGQGPYGAFQQ